MSKTESQRIKSYKKKMPLIVELSYIFITAHAWLKHFLPIATEISAFATVSSTRPRTQKVRILVLTFFYLMYSVAPYVMTLIFRSASYLANVTQCA